MIPTVCGRPFPVSTWQCCNAQPANKRRKRENMRQRRWWCKTKQNYVNNPQNKKRYKIKRKPKETKQLLFKDLTSLRLWGRLSESCAQSQLYKEMVFPVWCGRTWLHRTEPWPQLPSKTFGMNLNADCEPDQVETYSSRWMPIGL